MVSKTPIDSLRVPAIVRISNLAAIHHPLCRFLTRDFICHEINKSANLGIPYKSPLMTLLLQLLTGVGSFNMLLRESNSPANRWQLKKPNILKM